MTWNGIQFELPQQQADTWVPWKLNIKAKGNGFIYLNGICIGRYWQEEPQASYYPPECWLKFGGKNVIAISLRPVNGESGVDELSVAPDSFSAEYRN